MKLLVIFFFSVHTFSFAQSSVKELRPSEVKVLNLSSEGEARFESDQEIFASVVKKINEGSKPEDLSAEERRIWNETDETIEGYWDVMGAGCSWYCGGDAKDVTASSALQPQGTNSYDAGNAHDFSYKTAWVEGKSGSGIGEFLIYTFSAQTPRITDIIVVNGYVKSERAYYDNSRVKKLKMYLNDKPFAILNLEDRRSKQSFKFDPIGNSNRSNFAALKTQPDWTLKFEILEVYKGLKYDDVAITEIFFDGIDVH